MCLSTEQGALTIVRRSSSRGKTERESCSTPTDEQLDQLDLDTEHLPAVDTPDACDKAALSKLEVALFIANCSYMA
ncbi:Calcium/calmodulin-dependent 3',5'-cyclic nucleotide phosphodiesterase 1C [Operophtera brumata]|uniref:Calcium/calmodulin-dependent 3',5'-cyclic nucleotide phosphodiesterase 1C n=1 Tax=Operophtera brumata TaxID=104452 RepID=A0A0L7LFT4_OPEBR|nr:Calcium/calmodulin-dependent 3',5'-cyclic nucleotide phosphodiesterase 1C [Operophtera brumata]